ncbi:MAG: GMP/IMP nucleotidase [Gammaproteobacteria bacterium]|nr:GMP/IMP nucleotidase [Gammaproteobacteria bacterium]
MIDWKRTDTVFLDMDGTLLDLGFDNWFWRELVPRRYAQARGVSVADARTGITERYRRMEGELQWYCLDYWSAELELDLIALKQEVSAAITVMPHAEPFLRSLQDVPVRVVLLTNAHPVALSLKLGRTGIGRFFSAIVCSHDLGLPKESSGFWARLHDIEPYRPDRSALVDDSTAVLEAARAHGIDQTIAVRKPDQSQSPRIISHFPAIDDLRDITPF